MTTICLNMIVKNEEKIIMRALESTKDIIDCYCICDTGSTDNTIQLIEEFGAKCHINGKVISEPFVNFEHNRNKALAACIGMADYILLMDADMVLEIGPQFNKASILLASTYSILQGNDNYYYKNTRIVKNVPTNKYVGVTHEFISTQDPPILIDKEQLFFRDHGDGGCKTDKFDRDIKLLTTGLEQEPDNVRYMFYLANSYYCKCMYNEAIDMYQKRIKKGGWKQEVWYSNYRIGLCYMALKRAADAIYFWMEAYNICPERIENLYAIVKYYREIGHNLVAMQYYNIAGESFERKDDNFLFLENDVYTYKLDYEYSIIAFYVGIANIDDTITYLLNTSQCPYNIITSVLANLQYYNNLICSPVRIFDFSDNFSKEINGKNIKFVSSSACFLSMLDCNLLNVRYVNYNISDTGNYENCDDHIITINKCLILDKDMHIIAKKEHCLEQVTRRYAGVEDVRIYCSNPNNLKNSDISFIGTGYHDNNTLGIMCGIYTLEHFNKLLSNKSEITCTSSTSVCEKNWTYVEYEGKTHVVYKWGPQLQLGLIENNRLSIVSEKKMPNIFSHVRGSTCGFVYSSIEPDAKDEIWFIVHLVSYESLRKYYHMFVVFDKSMNLLRYSAPFKFSKQPIEYCLSITVKDDCIIVPYSTMDRTTILAIYDKTAVDVMLMYF